MQLLVALAAMALLVPSGAAFAQRQPTIALEEVERGQIGYGVTVFAGTEPERFEVEVVGVLRDLNPGVSFILARLEGHGLERTGVIGGMSGSPVYLEGRLAGAVAFSWNFASEAIAGITPISQMRSLSELPLGTASPRSVGRLGRPAALFGLLESAPRRELLEEALDELVTMPATGQRPSVAFAASGFNARAQTLLGTMLQPLGPLAPAGRAEDSTTLPPLEPGSAVAGVLVSGDLELSVSGTVTERHGDEILAFGHPFLAIGPMRLPMAQAEVVTVVPSRLSSFKLTNVGKAIGAFDQDRLTGMRGRVGLEAATTPLSLRISGAAERSYEIEIADLPAMRPSLIAISVLQMIDAASRSSGDQGLDLAVRFDLADHGSLALRQTFDGAGASVDAAIYLLQIVGFLELNSWVDVEVERIDVEVEISEKPRTATLREVHPSQRTVRPGDQLELFLELEDYRGERFRRTHPVAIPADLEPGAYYLFVGDGMSVDAAKLRVEPFEPEDFASALELLASYHARDELVVLGVRGRERGLVVEGRSLPSLPGSMRSIWEASSRGQIKTLGLAVVSSSAVRFDRPLSGLVRVDLQVERPRPQGGGR